MSNKSQWIQTILKMATADRIKQLGKQTISPVIKKTPQYFIKKQRRLQTPDQLIRLCQLNDIYTFQQCRQYNRTHVQKISIASIKYWFGSWKSFKRRLVAKPSKKTKFQQSHVIDTCVRFNIKNTSDFQQFHKKQPTILPSVDWVQRHFGGWKYFKRILQACSVQLTLQKYIDLKAKLRRYPSKLQCKKNNIQLQLLLSVWQPSQFKQTVQLLQRIYKNAKK